MGDSSVINPDTPIREQYKPFDYKTPDGYEFYLRTGPLQNFDEKYFHGKIEYWKELLEQEATGNRARVEAWFAKYGAMPPQLAKALESASDVPVPDIIGLTTEVDLRTSAGAFGPDLARKLSQLVKMEKNVMRSMEVGTLFLHSGKAMNLADVQNPHAHFSPIIARRKRTHGSGPAVVNLG
jgi:hypothetical protein